MLVIPRYSGPEPGSDKLTWQPSRDPRYRAYIWCDAGHLSGLPHDIDDDGAVTPSVVCAKPDCPFHDFVRLAGWGSANG